MPGAGPARNNRTRNSGRHLRSTVFSAYAGNDILDGRGGADYLVGGPGDDTYYIYSAAGASLSSEEPQSLITVTGLVIEQPGEGVDTIYSHIDYTLPANVEVLNLIGSALKGTIKSGEGWIYGNPGNNTFESRGAVGHLLGGTGNDAYFVDNPLTAIVENAGEGSDTVYAYGDFTLPTNVEVLNLKGAAIRSTISSGEGWSSGNVGNNIFDARGAIGHLSGLAGNDVYYLDKVSTTVVEAANAGIDTVYAYCDYTLPANVEVLNLKGAAIRGTISAGEGWIYGNANDNILDARGALGHLYGGAGDDTYYVGGATTTVLENVNEGIDTVHAGVSYTPGANVENLILDGTGNSTAPATRSTMR